MRDLVMRFVVEVLSLLHWCSSNTKLLRTDPRRKSQSRLWTPVTVLRESHGFHRELQQPMTHASLLLLTS